MLALKGSLNSGDESIDHQLSHQQSPARLAVDGRRLAAQP
jgi:hypothetical protein